MGGIRGAGTVPTCVCDVSFVPTAGSYVALTVQGRPPGSPQIPLADSDVDLAAFGHMSPIMASPHSPGTSGNAERITSPVLMGVRLELSFQKEKWSWVVLIFFNWYWDIYLVSGCLFARKKGILQVKMSSPVSGNRNTGFYTVESCSELRKNTQETVGNSNCFSQGLSEPVFRK